MRYLALALPLILVACVKEPKQAAPAPPKPVVVTSPAPPRPKPAPTPLAETWQDAAFAAGDWVYRRDSRGSVALFGARNADASFLVRCDANAQKIFLLRAGAVTDGSNAQMTIRASSGFKSFTVRNNGDTPPYVAVELAVREPQLDAMAYSRGRFLVSVKGNEDLVIPSWPEVARVIEDCRG
jgi:hypothetical protein